MRERQAMEEQAAAVAPAVLEEEEDFRPPVAPVVLEGGVGR
jgi:hypothetical protein